MRIIRMHCPSQSAQDYMAETLWQGIARRLYSLITIDAYFGPLLPAAAAAASAASGGRIVGATRLTSSRGMAFRANEAATEAVRDRPQWGGRKLSIAGPPERLKEAGRSVFRGKGKGQGKDKGEGEDDPKGEGEGKE